MMTRPYDTPPPDCGLAKLYRHDRRRAAIRAALRELGMKLLIGAVAPAVAASLLVYFATPHR